MAEVHTSSDYLGALQGLMPRGAVWPTDAAAIQTKVLSAFAELFAADERAALDLLASAFPWSVTDLLPEWEASLGLPDPCEGAAQTLQQRQAQVATRFAAQGGQSVGYLEQAARGLGYDADIIEFAPFRVGVDATDRPLLGEQWAHVFQVNTPGARVFYFEADVSAADEPLVTVVNDSIVCLINELKPAHTLALFGNLGELVFGIPDESQLIPSL